MTIEFFILLAIFFLFLLYLYLTRNYNHWKNKNVSYLPPKLLFGNMLKMFQLKRNLGGLLFDFYMQTSEPFLGFFIMDHPCLLVKDLQLIKDILVKDFDSFDDRTNANNDKDDPMGSHMLFLVKNPKWRSIRKKLTPAYTTGKIRNFHKLIDEAATDMLNFLDQQIATGVELFEVKNLATKFTTDAITSTAFGVKAHSFDDARAAFLTASTRAFNFAIFERSVATTCYFLSPFLVKWLHLKFIDTQSSDFLRDAFWKTMKERERTGNFRNDLIDILIELKKEEEFDEDDFKIMEGDRMVAQAAQFFFAGTETSSTVISFGLYELALNHKIQSRVRNEIIECLEKNNGTFTYDNLNRLEYFDMFTKETLRKYPSVPFLDRTCKSDYKIPGTDITIEKGTKVFISSLGVHYDPAYYPDPEKFDPERFSPEQVLSRPTTAFLTFGEGPRHCIGARFGSISVKTSIARILTKYQVETCDKTQSPMEFDQRGFLLAPIGGLYLRFKKIR